MLRYSENPQHAIDLPRICISPPEANQPKLPTTLRSFTDMSISIVHLEEGIEATVINKLEEMGHTCYSVKGHGRLITFGRGQIIRARNKDTLPGRYVLAAGSDPRADGHAAPAIISNKL
ncbi:hypothetical protein INT45_009283 [Circinella minor]|uniref:Uncharacterized protein n=1 Tax=Circinella minor TaxID=1195481 RepID=A0A8H7VND8_9FUNG|nr:hypothetical protein INT45_009283 [Circinella minor]